MPTDSHRRPARHLRAALLLAVKILLSVALLAILARSGDWQAMQERLALLSPLPAAAALLCLAVVPGLAALRWNLVLSSAGKPLGFPRALRHVLAGLFFGQFLPASVGQDAVRSVFAYRAGVTVPQVASALVLDRAFGLLALVVLIFLGLPVLAALAPVDMTAAVSGAAAAVGAAILAGPFADRLPWPHTIRHSRLGTVLTWIGDIRRRLWSLQALPVLMVSLVLHACIVAAVGFIAAALALGVGPLGCLAVVPTAVLLANLPISLNGWGVREGAMVVGFGLLGVAAADAFVVSVLLGLGMALTTLPGAFVWLGRTRTAVPSAATVRADSL